MSDFKGRDTLIIESFEEFMERLEKEERSLHKEEISKQCTCGAKHTSNPGYHLKYCDIKGLK